jgi:hypothetical protein
MFDRMVSMGGWVHGVAEQDIGTELPLRTDDFYDEVQIRMTWLDEVCSLNGYSVASGASKSTRSEDARSLHLPRPCLHGLLPSLSQVHAALWPGHRLQCTTEPAVVGSDRDNGQPIPT